MAVEQHNTNTTTRTQATLNQYLETARRLEKLARKEILEDMPYAIGARDVISVMQFSVWLIERMKAAKISGATYRVHKAALIASFEQLDQDEEVKMAIDMLRSTHHVKGLKPTIKKTSSKKSKSCSMEDLVKLTDYMQGRKGKHNVLSSLWLTATYHMGLRPCEWQYAVITQATFDDNSLPETALRVRNAKSTNGRAHGEFRHLPLHHLDPDSFETVIAFVMLLEVEMQSKSFGVIHAGCKQAIYQMSRRCFTRRHKGVSRYTMRHQFSANAKNSLSLNEVGALMGHAVADTSKINYARASVGHVITGLKAMKAEVARVKSETPSPYARKPEPPDLVAE